MFYEVVNLNEYFVSCIFIASSCISYTSQCNSLGILLLFVCVFVHMTSSRFLLSRCCSVANITTVLTA